jgi:ribosomal protein L20A (L18A)
MERKTNPFTNISVAILSMFASLFGQAKAEEPKIIKEPTRATRPAPVIKDEPRPATRPGALPGGVIEVPGLMEELRKKARELPPSLENEPTPVPRPAPRPADTSTNSLPDGLKGSLDVYNPVSKAGHIEILETLMRAMITENASTGIQSVLNSKIVSALDNFEKKLVLEMSLKEAIDSIILEYETVIVDLIIKVNKNLRDRAIVEKATQDIYSNIIDLEQVLTSLAAKAKIKFDSNKVIDISEILKTNIGNNPIISPYYSTYINWKKSKSTPT